MFIFGNSGRGLAGVGLGGHGPQGLGGPGPDTGERP